MIDQIIIEYLAGNKRLVIPDLGTFIRKDSGEIVFVEFMKKDDGVLAALEAKRNGSSTDAAMAEIALYVTAVKRAVDSKGEYPVIGFGRMYKTPEGTLEFDRNPGGAATLSSIEKTAPRIETPEKRPQPVQPEATTQTPQQPLAVPPPVSTKPAPEPQQPSPTEKSPRAERVAADKLFEAASGTGQASALAQKEDLTQPRASDASCQSLDFGQNRTGGIRSPRPDTQKPQKATPATRGPQQGIPRPRPAAPAPKRRKTDMVMVIAVLAAIIAIIALGFSMYVNSGPANNLKSTNYIEQQATTPAPDDAALTSIDKKN